MVINDKVALDKDWAPFVVVHQSKIGYLITFELLSPDTHVFNNDGVEVVMECKKHDVAFAMDAWKVYLPGLLSMRLFV